MSFFQCDPAAFHYPVIVFIKFAEVQSHKDIIQQLEKDVKMHHFLKCDPPVPIFTNSDCLGTTLEATWVPGNVQCKRAALTLIRGFAGVCLSDLLPVIPGKVNRISTHVTVSADFFLEHFLEFRSFVVPFKLNQCLLSSPHREICRPLCLRHIGLEGTHVYLLCFGAMWYTLRIITVVHHGCLKAQNNVKGIISIACFCLLLSLLKVVVFAKSPKRDSCCHLADKNSSISAAQKW